MRSFDTGSLVKGAVVFWNKKMTEGFLQNHIKSTLQSLRVAYGNPPPFTREAEIRSPANSYQIKNGRTQFAPTVRRRLHRIVRNSLWLSLAHYATPPFPQKSRSARLFGCKRPHDGSLSLPTFADCGQPQVAPTGCADIPIRAKHSLLFTLHFSLFSAR